MMDFAPFQTTQVAAVFDRWEPAIRLPLLQLRQHILDVAAQTGGVGPLAETLKWGEPAWLPATPGTGTTLRINRLKRSRTGYALFVPCQTGLIQTFAQHYPGTFAFQGNRAILLDAGTAIDVLPLRHCIALALTCHRRKATAAARADR